MGESLTPLGGIDGNANASVKNRAVVTYDPTVVTTSQMISAIKTLGYPATIETSMGIR